VTVVVERSGRSLSSVSVRAEQDGRTIALALAALATGYPSPIELANAQMPDVAAPEALEAPSWEGLPEAFRPPAFAGNFELLPATGTPVYSSGEEAYTGGWIRLRQERPLDEPLLVAIADSWLPAVFSVVDRPLLAPTIDLTVHLRAPLPRPWDFVFIDVRTDTAREGFIEEDTRVFARDGTLLAHSRQLALALEL
jgi:acyl-CoA thioesterase